MTTRECVHLIIGSYFRSRNKDDSHAVRSAVGENPMLHTHFTALCYRRGLSYWNCHTVGIRICAGM